jgi:hypothetical protein
VAQSQLLAQAVAASQVLRSPVSPALERPVRQSQAAARVAPGLQQLEAAVNQALPVPLRVLPRSRERVVPAA